MPSPAYELTSCPVCGTTASEEIAGGDAVHDEVELLWEFHERRLRPATPTARLIDRVAFSEHPPMRLGRCVRCGLLYRNPVERPHELTEIYQEAPEREALSALHAVQRDAYRVQARRLLAMMRRRGDGLEVGSYVGAFLAAARDVGLRFEGLDVNEEVNAFTRSLGFVVHEGELDGESIARTFDAVAIWNCFDQLPDPRGAALAAHRCLRPGGTLAIRVPNGAFYARMRALLDGRRAALARAALAHNNLLGFPYRHGFTPESMVMLLERSGFVVRQLVGDVLVPIADEYTHRWAGVEERLLKGVLRVAARRSLAWAPWFETYAEKAD